MIDKTSIKKYYVYKFKSRPVAAYSGKLLKLGAMLCLIFLPRWLLMTAPRIKYITRQTRLMIQPDLKTSLARQMLYTRNYEKYRQGLKVVARTEQAQKAEQYREKQVTLFFQSKVCRDVRL